MVSGRNGTVFECTYYYYPITADTVFGYVAALELIYSRGGGGVEWMVGSCPTHTLIVDAAAEITFNYDNEL